MPAPAACVLARLLGLCKNRLFLVESPTGGSFFCFVEITYQKAVQFHPAGNCAAFDLQASFFRPERNFLFGTVEKSFYISVMHSHHDSTDHKRKKR